jgi:hypothetical protein
MSTTTQIAAATPLVPIVSAAIRLAQGEDPHDHVHPDLIAIDVPYDLELITETLVSTPYESHLGAKESIDLLFANNSRELRKLFAEALAHPEKFSAHGAFANPISMIAMTPYELLAKHTEKVICPKGSTPRIYPNPVRESALACEMASDRIDFAVSLQRYIIRHPREDVFQMLYEPGTQDFYRRATLLSVHIIEKAFKYFATPAPLGDIAPFVALMERVDLEKSMRKQCADEEKRSHRLCYPQAALSATSAPK